MKYEYRVTYECLGDLADKGVETGDWRIAHVISSANEPSNYVFVFWERMVDTTDLMR